MCKSEKDVIFTVMTARSVKKQMILVLYKISRGNDPDTVIVKWYSSYLSTSTNFSQYI